MPVRHPADRVYPNRLGSDPARVAADHEPHYGYGPGYRYYPPSPVAAKLMDECIGFAHFWLNSVQHAADRRWKRVDAIQQQRRNHARCRELNIQLLREYLPNLTKAARVRAYATIANLQRQQ